MAPQQLRSALKRCDTSVGRGRRRATGAGPALEEPDQLCGVADPQVTSAPGVGHLSTDPPAQLNSPAHVWQRSQAPSFTPGMVDPSQSLKKRLPSVAGP
jgi:hypothetical protein